MNEEYPDPERDFQGTEWTAPPPAADFHFRVLNAFQREFGQAPWWKRWPAAFVPDTGKGLLAGVTLGVAVCLLAITQVFPQSLKLFSPGFRIPFVVEYEFVRYSADGSPAFTAHIASFKNGGDQIILRATDSGSNALVNMVRGVLYSGRMFVLQLAPSLIIPPQSNESVARNRALVSNDCQSGGSDAVIGHETVLGHATTVLQFSSPGHMRTTMWLAPGLGCFDLRHINEEQQPDGTFRPVLRSNALKVTVNP